MKLFSRLTLAVATATAAVTVAQPALAADTNSNDRGYQMLQEVVVTAQKRSQTQLNVAASVTSLDAENLADSGMTSFTDYASQVPGMSVTSVSRGNNSVVLRGMSTGISQATPSTAFYIDDAPVGSVNAYDLGSTLTPDLDPYEVQRIEVLEGPQGTLYGADAIGGIVHYVTRPPNPHDFSGAVTAGANSITDGGTGWDSRMFLNAPLTGQMALRVNAFTRTDAGYINDPLNGKTDVNQSHTDGGMIAFGWQLAPEWKLTLWALTQRFRAGGIGAENVNAPSLAPVDGNLTRSTYIPESDHITLDVYNADVHGRVGNFKIVSSTTLQTNDSNDHIDATSTLGPVLDFALGPILSAFGIPGLGVDENQLVDTRRISQELRLSSSAFGDALQYEGGLFYTHEGDSNRLPPNALFNTATLAPAVLPSPFTLPPLFNAYIDSKYTEYSIYANLTYSLTPKFQLSAGGRYAHDVQHFVENYQRSIATPIPTFVEQSTSESKATYSLGARYKPQKDTSVYARIASGYQPGGPNALPPAAVPGVGDSFQPSTVTSYELGVKSVTSDNRVSIDTAVFTINWQNVQIQTSAVATSGASYQYFVNGGSAVSRGAQATVVVLPVSRLSLRFTGAFTDSHLTENAPAADGLDGDRMPFVPRWTGSFLADYRFAPIGSWHPFFGAGLDYVGNRISNFSGKAPFDVPSYTTANLNAGADVGRLRIALYGKNLNNSHGITYINGVGPNPDPHAINNPYAAGIIEPRTVGFDVSYRF